MRFSLSLIFTLVLLGSCAFGQEPVPTAPEPPVPPAEQPAPPSPPPIELRPDVSGTVPQEQIRELLRRVAEKDLENEKRLRDYTYIQREEERKLDGHGKVKKIESRTSEVLVVYGEQVQRKIAKDDKLLSADETKKEEERIQKITDKRKNESDSDRRKRLEKEEKDREEGRKFVLEIADAYNFRLAGSELLDGRETWALDANPRPGYEPKRREAKVLPKLRGRIWIDKAEAQWVKFDVTTTDTISFGLFLARIHKGTRIVVETTRVNEEVWLPKHVAVHIDLRLALLKNYDVDVEQTFRDYKKFRSESKITVVGESQ
ncbi:MAG: hypothetical protein HY233_07220 [Acidobacteriales bacterium]|nr:hypothetical protein [Candidatus Koribacter versatilis]MBI3645736.1 hypothetical protein [Terriglobales bacterium]